MGFGAGMFKPIISGTIARVTDESNSTQAFGIFYWSINLGAFLFPLFLVPFLKSMNPSYVIIASAICTGFLLIPTALLYKDPIKRDKAKKRDQTSLVQTLANAFEIIYSPLVLLSSKIKRSNLFKLVTLTLLALFFILSVFNYLKTPKAEGKYSKIAVEKGEKTLIFDLNRNMLIKDYKKEESENIYLTLYKPDKLESYLSKLIKKLRELPCLKDVSEKEVNELVKKSERKISLIMERKDLNGIQFQIKKISEEKFVIYIDNKSDINEIKGLAHAMHNFHMLCIISLF
jgi:hypothetical protein